MNLIDTILNREEFKQKPPVLLDIGASVSFYAPWKALAPYSICVAFDADAREMSHASEKAHPYKKLFLHQSIAVTDEAGETEFFLTKSPVCSSTLEPEKENLRRWAHGAMFEVIKKTRVKSEALNAVIKEHGLSHIDWFKSDSQGTDLRLFKSLDLRIAQSVLAADFEPGIIDAYKKEDKIWHLMEYMETMPFWLNGMSIRGVRRLGEYESTQLEANELRAFQVATQESPGWAEISYFNNLEGRDLTTREYLLLWIIATLKGHDGYALEIALRGGKKFNDPIFDELQAENKRTVTRKYRYAKKANTLNKIETTLKRLGKGLLSRFF